MDKSLLTSLAMSPRIVERMLRVFPTDRLDDRDSDQSFSPREAIASFADMEKIALERATIAVRNPGTPVENVDAATRSREAYAETNPFHEAEVFESRRLMTVEFLQGLTPDDFRKTLILSGKEITLAEYCSLILAHDMFHVDELSRYLATEAATLS
jgi:hypothetical protein